MWNEDNLANVRKNVIHSGINIGKSVGKSVYMRGKNVDASVGILFNGGIEMGK